MKLIRWIQSGKIITGILADEQVFDVSSIIADYDESFFSSGGMNILQAAIQSKAAHIKKISGEIRLISPVPRPSKIICVGLNYADHARETNAIPPAEPVLFLKSTTALCGPYDHIIIPKNSVKTDWEVELAVVISKKASYVEEADAGDFIAGYCLHNDVSERAFQLERSGTWDKGKGCDHFAPLGPWLVTPDEIRDVNSLRLWLKVNGTLKQDGNSGNLIFKIPFLISYISQFMTLLPGDIISTGTPAGVGMGKNPPEYLKPGDIVELGIDGLGIARQQVVSYNLNGN